MPNQDSQLVIEPAAPKSLLALLATLQPLDEDFPPIEELPYETQFVLVPDLATENWIR